MKVEGGKHQRNFTSHSIWIGVREPLDNMFVFRNVLQHWKWMTTKIGYHLRENINSSNIKSDLNTSQLFSSRHSTLWEDTV